MWQGANPDHNDCGASLAKRNKQGARGGASDDRFCSDNGASKLFALSLGAVEHAQFFTI